MRTVHSDFSDTSNIKDISYDSSNLSDIAKDFNQATQDKASAIFQSGGPDTVVRVVTTVSEEV